MNLVRVTHLIKAYQSGEEAVPAINDVSFKLEQGKFAAIVGPSGSGKSTLLTILGGLNRPSAGNINIDDIDIYSLPNERLADFRREYLGFVFQSFQLISYLTVLENVKIPLSITALSSGEQDEKAEKILNKVGLINKLKRLPGELSGGEQERVAIARALVNQPPIVLADEPTGNLDSTTGHEIMELFHALNDEGQTIVMVTHNSDYLEYADFVIHLCDGQVIDTVDQQKTINSFIDN